MNRSVFRVLAPGRSSGVSLLELIIGIGIGAVGIYVATNMISHTQRASQESIKRARTNDYLFLMQNSLSKGISVPVLRTFTRNSTFWTADLAQHQRIGNVGETGNVFFQMQGSVRHEFNRDSFTLDVSNDQSREQGEQSSTIIMSRCIEADDVHEEFTVQKLKSLDRYPFIFDRGDRQEVECCRIRNGQPRNCQELTGVDSEFRARFVLLRNGRVTMVPRPSDLRYSAGAGFYVYLDHATEPDAAVLASFLITNECISALDGGRPQQNCRDVSYYKLKAFEQEFESDVYETGMFNLGTH